MKEIQKVKLNKKEQALFDAVFPVWDELDKKDYDTRVGVLEKMGQLTEMLLERAAIPKVRVAYFVDPKMNVGGYGKSRKELFEKNGTSGQDILRHPNFMAYLRYFIYGPDLPMDTIKGFCEIIEKDRGTSGMVLDQIKVFVRKEIRGKHLDVGHAANEFFKLACEIGKPNLAESVRSAAKSVRK